MRPEIVTTPERSQLMSQVRQKNTSIEIKLKSILSRLGLKYEQNVKKFPGSPDFINQEEKWAIFAHGCFWHAHEGCQRWKIPYRNRAFWDAKFKKNRERDKRKLEEMKEIGYSVLVIWGCEIESFKVYEKLTKFFHTPFEVYNFSETKKSVIRTVYGSSGQNHQTRMIIKDDKLMKLDAHSAFDLAFLRRRTSPKMSHYSDFVRCVDLYSGCGGLSLGVREACRAIGKNFLSVAAVEKKSEILEVYLRNLGCIYPFPEDITNLLNGEIGESPNDNEKNFLSKIMPVKILLAGPPCQGYSDLNNHTRRNDPRNALYRCVTRFIELGKPEFVLVENVQTVIHGKNGEVDEAIEVMEDLDYHVDSKVVDLSRVGVPQRRKRHILIGSLLKKVSIEKTVQKFSLDSERSVNWAINDLTNIKKEVIFNKASRHSKENMKRIRYLHENNLFDLPDELRPECHRDGEHSYKSMYGRMRPDEAAQTITSGFGSPGQGRFIHPTKLRTITPHEAARLQFFPDFFDFSNINKRTTLAEIIGNAAPYKLSYVFTLEFLG